MISLIKQRLLECGNHFSPGISPDEIRLRPCLDLKWGDLESDIVFVIAERLRRQPDLVCKEVLKFLRGAVALNATSAHNYINFSLSDYTLLAETTDFSFEQESLYPIRFAIPEEAALSESLRLLLAALFQVLFIRACGGNSDLRPLGNTIEPGSGPLYLWLYPETIKSGRLRTMSREYGELGRKLFINAPYRSWLSMDSRLDLSGLADKFSASEKASLLFLLASPRRGFELDVETATLAESSNLIWLTRTLLQRVSRVLEGEKGSFYLDESVKLEPLLRSIAHRIAFLPLHQRLAVEEGRVLDYIGSVEAFLADLNKLMGNPRYRLLWGGADGGMAAKILTGALSRLSDIITLYDKVEADIESSFRGYFSEFSSEQKKNRKI